MTLHTKKGYTLVEALVYIAVLVIIIYVTIQGMIALADSYKGTKAGMVLAQSTSSVIDSFSSEIKRANSIDTAQSIIGSPGFGKLVLNSTDENGIAETVEFYVDGSTLKIKKNGLEIGPLTNASISVLRLYFYVISTPVSDAVKLDLTLYNGQSIGFYYTVGLRN